MIKNKAIFRDSLQANIQNEIKEKNFLLEKNSQIVEINEKLKNDYTLCEAHLSNLKGSVDAQK